MRKILFLSATMLISIGIMAQNAAPKRIIGASNKYEKVQKLDRLQGNETTSSSKLVKPIRPLTKDVQSVTKFKMGSSWNIYTALISESAGMSANSDCNLITFTHRSNVSDGTASGNMYVSFSTDAGFSWDSTTVKTHDGTTNGGRYPGGVIYNPTGNTTASNAFAVTSGPALIGGDWGGNFFGTMQFDGTNGNSQYSLYTTDTLGGVGVMNQFARIHLQARGNKFFVLGDANTDDGSFYTGYTTIVNKGAWDATGDSVVWTTVSHIPDYLTDGSGNPDGYATPGLVMADDALTGYLVYIGRDGAAVDNLTYQPLIYKTTDGGSNWIKEAAFDWTASTTLSTLATDLSPGVGRPMFGSIKDITMDNDGYVHILSYIHGAYSDNLDSLGYYNVFNLWNGIVCDIHQTATGWDAFVVDTVWAKDVDDTNTPITDPLGWDERFQMSTTPDRTKIFYAWMDTDTLLSTDNLYPDINVKMYDVATATIYPKVNLTRGTSYDAYNYWMYLSDVTFDLSGSYQLHISTTDLNTNDIGPVNHYYMSGVILDNTGQLIAGVEDMPLQSFVSLYPNPTSDNLNLSFNTNARGDYNITIFNTLGSVVMSDIVNVNGAAIQTINLENLPTGIYMIEISNNSGSMTKKIIKN